MERAVRQPVNKFVIKEKLQMLKYFRNFVMALVALVVACLPIGVALANEKQACLKKCEQSDNKCVNCSSAYYYNDRNPNYYNKEVKECKSVYDKIGVSNKACRRHKTSCDADCN